jgi:hypothetical protein
MTPEQEKALFTKKLLNLEKATKEKDEVAASAHYTSGMAYQAAGQAVKELKELRRRMDKLVSNLEDMDRRLRAIEDLLGGSRRAKAAEGK